MSEQERVIPSVASSLPMPSVVSINETIVFLCDALEKLPKHQGKVNDDSQRLIKLAVDAGNSRRAAEWALTQMQSANWIELHRMVWGGPVWTDAHKRPRSAAIALKHATTSSDTVAKKNTFDVSNYGVVVTDQFWHRRHCLQCDALVVDPDTNRGDCDECRSRGWTNPSLEYIAKMLKMTEDDPIGDPVSDLIDALAVRIEKLRLAMEDRKILDEDESLLSDHFKKLYNRFIKMGLAATVKDAKAIGIDDAVAILTKGEKPSTGESKPTLTEHQKYQVAEAKKWLKWKTKQEKNSPGKRVMRASYHDAMKLANKPIGSNDDINEGTKMLRR